MSNSLSFDNLLTQAPAARAAIAELTRGPMARAKPVDYARWILIKNKRHIDYEVLLDSIRNIIDSNHYGLSVNQKNLLTQCLETALSSGKDHKSHREAVLSTLAELIQAID